MGICLVWLLNNQTGRRFAISWMSCVLQEGNFNCKFKSFRKGPRPARFHDDDGGANASSHAAF